MGDGADYFLDQLGDPDPDSPTGVCGFDDVMYDAETDTYSGSGHSKAKRCRFCGSAPLFWSELDGKWRLVDGSGDVHKCAEYRRE